MTKIKEELAMKEELAKIRKLKVEIAIEQEKIAWRKLMNAKMKMISLQLKYDWRSNLRKEILLDKFLVTLRPWANSKQHKKNGGKGWKDDC